MAKVLPLPKRYHPDFRVPGRKPVGPVEIDWSNPLAKGLAAVFVATPAGYVDVVSRVSPSTVASAVRGSQHGLTRDYQGSASTYDVFSLIPQYKLEEASGSTVAVKVDIDALTNYGALVACQNTTTTYGWEIRLGAGSSDSRLLAHRSNSSGYNQWTADGSNSVLTAGTKDQLVAVTFADNQMATAPKIYVTETGYYPSTTSHASAGSGTYQGATTGDLYIGSRYDSVTRLDGGIRFIALWDRPLSELELRFFDADPYQILKPAVELHWYYAAAASGFSVTDIDLDDTVYDGQSTVIHGTGFGVTQGQVFIGSVAQTVTGWADTQINVTVVKGGLSLGAQTLQVLKPA